MAMRNLINGGGKENLNSAQDINIIAGNQISIGDTVYTIQGENSQFMLPLSVRAITFSPDGTKLVLGGAFTGYAKIYSVSGTTITFISDIYADAGTTALSSTVYSISFSPDGTKLVLGGKFSGRAKIYSVSGTTVTFVSNIYANAGTTALSNYVYSASFSPDGTKLILGGAFTGRAKIYSVSGTTVTFVSNIYANAGTTALSSTVQSVSFSSDGTNLVLTGSFTDQAKIYSVSGTTVTFVSNIYADAGTTTLDNYSYSASFSPDGTKLILGGAFTGKAKIYSVSGTTVTYILDIYADDGTIILSSIVNSVSFSLDGTKLVLGGYFIGYAKIYSVSGTNITYISNIYADSGTTALDNYVYSTSFSPDGTKLILGGDFTGKAKIYSVSGTTVTFVSNIDAGATALSSIVYAASFSPDGTKLILGGAFTGYAKLYSVSGTTVTFVSDIYSDAGTTALSYYVYSSSFSPDGTKLVLGGGFSGYAKIYSVSGTTVTFVSNIYADGGTTSLSNTVQSVSFSSDGTKLVLGGGFSGYAKIYSVSGTTVTFVSNIYANAGTTALSYTVYIASFSPDGTKLVLGGAFTGYAKIYSVSGTTVAFVSDIYADAGTTALSMAVNSAVFSPDGTKLVLGGSFSGYGKIYSISDFTHPVVYGFYLKGFSATQVPTISYSVGYSKDNIELGSQGTLIEIATLVDQ